MPRHLGFAAALLAAAPAFGQDADAPGRVVNGQPFGAWNVVCEAVAIDETTCVLAQQLLREPDQAFIAQILALWSGADGKRFFSARVPLGAHLPSGFVMKPEGADYEVQLAWQACNPTFCEAVAEIDDATLADFSAPDTPIIASYRPSALSEPVVFTFSMAGAQEGLAALRPE